jgi:hypothetical protein
MDEPARPYLHRGAGAAVIGTLALVCSWPLQKGVLMPGGSAYQGPGDALERYVAVAEGAGEPVKGAKNPYTSRNGHMFSFLDGEGEMALRLSEDLTDEFLSRYDSGPVIRYGSVMRGYVSIPDVLLSDTEELGSWFNKAYNWIGTLELKPTKKRS